ncbi:MAG: type II toxin-antitoxin system VapC family toxin [Candidatus Binatia bacterium]
MTFVLDNSVTMRWYFGDDAPSPMAYATHVLETLTTADAVVPVVWSLEVANVLARAEAKKLATEAKSEAFVALLRRLAINVDGEGVNHALENTLQLARRYGLSSYDASYLELAMREGLPLATLDEGLLKAAKRAGVKRYPGK